MALTLVHHRFSVDDYEQMIESIRILRSGQEIEIAALTGSRLAVADVL